MTKKNPAVVFVMMVSAVVPGTCGIGARAQAAGEKTAPPVEISKDELSTTVPAALHKATDANDEDAMLEQTEAFHSAFEGLVRTIRPVVPALEAFHQELYKLYHYHAPDYDLANIRAQALAMKEKIPALAESTLPTRLADRQEAFDAAVASLSEAVDDLVKTAEMDNRDAILTSVENVHSTYVKTVAIFE